jgi:hypothetical protein
MLTYAAVAAAAVAAAARDSLLALLVQKYKY